MNIRSPSFSGDRHPVLGGDHDVLEISGALDQAETAHHRPRPARLDDVAPEVPVAPHDRVDDGREGDPVGPEPVRVDVDLVLPDDPTDAGDLGHAGHRVELVADEPVLEGPQVPQRVARSLDGVPEDVADAGRVRAQRRPVPGGSDLPRSCRRSRTRDRAKYRSTWSSKITLIIEKPKAGEERTTRTPGRPCRLTVSGYVIWSSTSWGERPAQSVKTIT
jgi:hypothetical protein